MQSIARAQEKLFILTSNYPKGDGDTFRSHMEENYTDTLLMHVLSLKENRQDTIMKCSSAMQMSRSYYVEYLDRRSRAHKKINVSEENSLIILTSV